MLRTATHLTLARIATLLFVVGALLAPVVLPSAAHAQAPQVHWRQYAYVVAVQPNGDLRFTETQTLVIDSGTVRKGTLRFNTGDYGKVRDIVVAEAGQAFARGTDERAGTFSGSDSGPNVAITYFFRDPAARQHTITISYLVTDALRTMDGAVALRWNFFCGNNGCPRTDQASVAVNFVTPTGNATLADTTSGFAVDRTSVANGLAWTARGAVTGQQLVLDLRFPPALVPEVNVGALGVQEVQNAPAAPTTTVAPATTTELALGLGFCGVVVLAIGAGLWFGIRTMLRAMRRKAAPMVGAGAAGLGMVNNSLQNILNGPGATHFVPTPPAPAPSAPSPRRRRTPRKATAPVMPQAPQGQRKPVVPAQPRPRARPPVVPVPAQPPVITVLPVFPAPTPPSTWEAAPVAPHGDANSSAGGSDSYSNPSTSGGGSSWNDSSGGGSSWSDTSGGGSSWNDASSSGSSWSDNSSTSAGGSDNSSSFS